jgi:RimJ/RimL family protein N-acetyltransferase
LATEAGRAFIGFGFTQLRLIRMVATVQVGNAVSVHVTEKLGFTRFGTERGGVRSFLNFELPNPF